MGKIIRNPEAAAKETYDLIIVGGGIYGVMLSFEATKRGLKSLLLEKDDFGGATTFNCLRTLHGGFRYLQTMDLRRFHESVKERQWFLRTFPNFVEPMSCIMPLYGNGLRRPSILRIASWLNDALSYKRNEGVRPDKHLPAVEIVSAKQTKNIFPSVDRQGLQGGVIWYDALMPDSQLIVILLLRWSCENGASALNYVEANELLKDGSDLKGILATDRENGRTYEYKTTVVINAGGPWNRGLASKFDREEPKLFKSSLAWNVLFNKNPPSSHTLAVAPKKPGARTYFILPWKGKVLAGTGHAAWFENVDNPMPSTEMIKEFIDDLNLSVPSINLMHKDILHVFAGLLPVKKAGTVDLAVREIIHCHADYGGPKGFYSVSGVKFTTARLVAEKLLKKIFSEKTELKDISTEGLNALRNHEREQIIFDSSRESATQERNLTEFLRPIIRDESVQHLDDLVFRRTCLWERPGKAIECAPYFGKLFDWDDQRQKHEFERLKIHLQMEFS